MNHKLTGPQPKPINLEKGVFESCGTFYFIHLEGMCYLRLKRFAELLPVVVYGRKFTDFAMLIHSLRIKMMSGGDDFKKTFFDVATELTNWDQYLLDNAGTYYDNVIDDILRFCALFIVTKDEDLTTLNDVHTELKIENWKKDMNIPDFFLLAKQQVPRFKELVGKLSEERDQREAESIPIPEN